MNKLHLSIAIIIAIPLLLSTSNSTHIVSFTASAQSNNTNATSSTITTEDIVNMSKPGEKLVLRGIVSSEDFNRVTLEPGDDPHEAAILPNNPDGSVYTGVLTFSASKPVEIGISHRLHIDNNTFSSIDTKELGDLYSGYHNNGGENGTPGEISVASVIVPDYGTHAPYFSASIPFVGDSVWLRTPDGEPFVAAYEVSADIVQPLGVVDLQSITNSTDQTITINSTQ